ncbi:MAG: ferredoxin [Bacilli bacterium]
MKVRVNQEACIGCGACQALVPDIFEIDDNGLAVAKDIKIDEELKEEVIDALEGCPTSAIEEVEEEKN